MSVILRLFAIIAKKTYHTNSKGYGTTNLLNHVPNYVKNPNRDALKGQQTLAFEPKMNGEEGFKLVPTAFTVEASRKAFAEMIILDELPFRLLKGMSFKDIQQPYNLSCKLGISHLVKLWLGM